MDDPVIGKKRKMDDLAERIETNGQPSRKKVRTSQKEGNEQCMTKPKGKKRKIGPGERKERKMDT